LSEIWVADQYEVLIIANLFFYYKQLVARADCWSRHSDNI